jgi:hypothetical protein
MKFWPGNSFGSAVLPVQYIRVDWHGDAVPVQFIGLVEDELQRAEHVVAVAVGLVIVRHRRWVRGRFAAVGRRRLGLEGWEEDKCTPVGF